MWFQKSPVPSPQVIVLLVAIVYFCCCCCLLLLLIFFFFKDYLSVMKQKTWDCIICWRHFKRSSFEMAPAHIYTRVYLYHDIYVHTQFIFQCYFIFSFLIHSSSMHCINLYLSYQFLSVPLREEWIVWLQFFTYAKHIECASLACFLFWHSVPGQLALAGVLTIIAGHGHTYSPVSPFTWLYQLLLRHSERLKASPHLRNPR